MHEHEDSKVTPTLHLSVARICDMVGYHFCDFVILSGKVKGVL